MNINRIVVLLLVAVVVLAAISIFQYRQLSKISAVVANLNTDSSGSGGSEQVRPQSSESNATDSVSSVREAAQELIPPGEPILQTKYWISTDFSDDKPYGFSLWIEAIAEGQLILERCVAPDYSVEINADDDPYKMPICQVIINENIQSIDDAQLVMTNGAILPISVIKIDNRETFTLTFEDEIIVLEPGQKNTVWQGLLNLPAVKQAQETAWFRHSNIALEAEKGKSGVAEVKRGQP